MVIGPVQLLVVSFDQPNFTGEIVAELKRLRESETVRLIDALVVQKGEDGSLVAVQWSDFSIEEAQGMGALVGALIGVGLDGEAGMEAGARAGMEAAATATSSMRTRPGTSATPFPTAAPPRSPSSSTCGPHLCATPSRAPVEFPSVTTGFIRRTSSRSAW